MACTWITILMVQCVLNDVRKTFNEGQVVAVDDVSLHIDEGELVVLVGPSGCGKSTTLRCIGGLEQPNSGSIEFGGQDVTGLPPKDRNVAMVFQNYALYPSMTVGENMQFGVKMKGLPTEEAREKVIWAAEMLQIEQLLDRYPGQLSGGQQQRVALGRAIVRDPSIFLLDEPLSNLDAKLRSVMRTEIQEIQRELNVATVFVTHDQEEAMTMGDRIAVMNAGRIEQVGTPIEIYHDPESLFVADFIGEPSINFFQATYDGSRLETSTFEKTVPEPIRQELDAELSGEDLVIGIRPENLVLNPSESPLFEVDVDVIEPVGNIQIVYFEIGDERFKSIVDVTNPVNEEDRIGVNFEWNAAHLFDRSGPKIVKWGKALDEETVTDVHTEREIPARGVRDDNQ